ncbi:hypothetical protein FEE95_05780 [Maribacter algarum]|uniref:Uncharacterized protein n=1 Tax=Maribacter algarum (ex Zhang et al. 2020) TaxID=2578118 RepID=A0A5S3PVB0_9FLAO|nr:hypothetical protein [Maribacter algarum]TMM58941.1 hypothetical protein FEE95_05780 [Maribacter algarum]
MLVKKKRSNPFLLVALGSFLLLLVLLSHKKGNSKTVKVIPEISQNTNYNSLQVILNEKHFETLKAKRDEAVSIGVLQTSDDDYVPATIRYMKEDYKASLRLKGDWTDHLEGLKWSYRIKLADDRTIKGMRKFSVHHPGSRGYLNEWLYHKAIKQEGLVGLRYDFLEGFLQVKMRSNDTAETKNVGIYAIEETFDKRLIENNGRKVGVILKLTEADMWRESAKVFEISKRTGTQVDGKYNPRYGSNNDMTITAYSLSTIFADTTLNKQFTLAKNLLNRYKRGELPISKVFDVEKTAKFTAIANLFGGTHGLTAHNLRWFYNPISSLIEPVAFDGNSGYKLPALKHYWKSESDLIFQKALYAALEEVSNPQYLENLQIKYQDDLNRLAKAQQAEFKGEAVLSLDILKENQEVLRQELSKRIIDKE